MIVALGAVTAVVLALGAVTTAASCDPSAPQEPPTGLAFVDTDPTFKAISGVLSWNEAPGVFTSSYMVYGSDYNASRSLLLSPPIPIGTHRLAIPTGTSISSGDTNITHILIAPANTWGEACGNGVALLAIVDLKAPSHVEFTDTDTSRSEIAGTITWTSAAALDMTGQSVFLSKGGHVRSRLLGHVPSSPTTPGQPQVGESISYAIPPDTPVGDATHLLIAMRRPGQRGNGGQDDYYAYVGGMPIVDTAVPDETVHSVVFIDEDTDEGEISGVVRWALPTSAQSTATLEYRIFGSSDGVSRNFEISSAGTRPAADALSFVVPASTTFHTEPYRSWNTSHLLVVATNQAGMSTVSSSVPVVDIAVPLLSPTDVTFVDLDPEPGRYSGTVRWTRPTRDDITHYRVYASVNGTSLSWELTSDSPPDRATRVLAGHAPSFELGPGTNLYDATHLRVTAANQHGNDRGTAAVILVDKAVRSAVNVTADPISATAIRLQWTHPVPGPGETPVPQEYEVRRLRHGDASPRYITLATVFNDVEYVDTGVRMVDGESDVYTYAVHAGQDDVFQSTGVQVSSRPVARVVHEPVPSLRVSGLTSTSASIRWEPDLRASAYAVEYRLASAASTSSNFSTAVFMNASSVYGSATTAASVLPQATVEGLQENSTYEIRVAAVNSHGVQSSGHASITCRPTSSAPAVPSVIVGHPLYHHIPLLWSSDPSATHFELHAKVTGTADTTYVAIPLPHSHNNYTHPNSSHALTPGTNHTLRLSAVNNWGAASTVVESKTAGLAVAITLTGSTLSVDPGAYVQLGDMQADDLRQAEVVAASA